jgi:spore coat protein U-like protein
MRHSAVWRNFRFICYISLLFGLSATAHAQTCTVSMPAVAFGNVNVLPGTAVDTTSTVTVTCSGGTTAGVRACINIGAGSSSDATSRRITGSGSNTARYNLYTNSTRTQLWGSWQTGYNVAGVQLDVPRNTTRTATVYARFLASQPTVAPGSYSATFTGDPNIRYGTRGTAVCPTGASTATANSSVTATVVSSCNVSASSVNFGTLGVLTANTDAQGILSIQCNSTLPYTVSLNGGNSGATDPTQRKMVSGAANITYGLYRDAARLLPWGATVGTNTASGTGTGLSQSQTVYGRVAPQTTPQPNTYSDSVVVTVGY